MMIVVWWSCINNDFERDGRQSRRKFMATTARESKSPYGEDGQRK